MKKEKIIEKRFQHFDDLGKVFGMSLLYWTYAPYDNQPILTISKKDANGCYYHGYIGHVVPMFRDETSIQADAYEYNGKSYNNLMDVIRDMEAYNQTLEYPIWTYDPTYHVSVRVRDKIRWYMENVLNFSFYTSDSIYQKEFDVFKRKNLYGKETYKFEIFYDYKYDDNTKDDEHWCKGKVIYMLDIGQWIEKPFNTFSEFIVAINGFIEPFMLTENALNIDTVENMGERGRDYQTTKVGCDTDSLKNTRTQCLNATKKALQMALERIEKQELKLQAL